MKIDWNRKYTTIAVYTVLTALAIMLLCALFINFGAVRRFFDTFNTIMSPVYIGLALAYIANPIMKMSEKRIFRFKVTSAKRMHLKRGLSIALSMIILLIIITILVLLIIPQVYLSLTDLGSKLGGYIRDTVAWLDSYLPDSIFNAADLTFENITSSIYEYFANSEFSEELSDLTAQLALLSDNLDVLISNSFNILKDYVPMVIGAVTGAANGVLNIALGIFFAIYILSSKEKLIAQAKKLIRAFASEKLYNSVLELANFSNKTFGGYLVGKILDSLIVGVVVFIACAICKIPYAILVSSLIAITNVIPVIGPFIGAIPGVLIIFIVDPPKVIWFLIINVVVQQIDGNIIVPKVLGETTGLSSLWVLFSITVMGGLWGVFGMFISVPIFAILYMLLKLFVEKRLTAQELPADTLEYYTDREIRDFTEDEENQHSFATRIKKHTETITPKTLSEKLREMLKKKKPDAGAEPESEEKEE